MYPFCDTFNSYTHYIVTMYQSAVIVTFIVHDITCFWCSIFGDDVLIFYITAFQEPYVLYFNVSSTYDEGLFFVEEVAFFNGTI